MEYTRTHPPTHARTNARTNACILSILVLVVNTLQYLYTAGSMVGVSFTQTGELDIVTRWSETTSAPRALSAVLQKAVSRKIVKLSCWRLPQKHLPVWIFFNFRYFFSRSFTLHRNAFSATAPMIILELRQKSSKRGITGLLYHAGGEQWRELPGCHSSYTGVNPPDSWEQIWNQNNHYDIIYDSDDEIMGYS